MGRRTSEGIQRTQGKNNESTGTINIQKKRKIQSGNRCIRTCYKCYELKSLGLDKRTTLVYE